MPEFTRDLAGIPRSPDGFIHEEQYRRDLDESIKKICPLAGYLHEEYGSFPECHRGDQPCPRPKICRDYAPGCLSIKAFQKACMKMPGKPCPENICPLRMIENQIARGNE